MADVAPLIRLYQVSRIYTVGERRFTALDGVDLSVARGEFLAVTGPSGSGKSTLLNLIAGIDQPTSGEVWVDKKRIDTMSENDLARWRSGMVGVVFQFFQLLPTLTVLENVLLPMQLQRLWSQPDQGKALAMIAQVGMTGQEGKLPSELSGGERQRIALARALINDPAIIIADEPTGNLDSGTGQGIIDLLRDEHRRGKTVVLVTHEERLAEMASRRVVMADGRVAADRRNGKQYRT